MPCRSDYMEPTAREAGSRQEAGLLVYVNSLLNIPTDHSIMRAAADPYGDRDRADEITAALCATIRKMTPEQVDAIVYNGRDVVARDLANWWDEHQEADRQRAEVEAKAEADRQRALALLSATTKLHKLQGRTGPDKDTITLTAAEQAALIYAATKVAA